MSKIDVVLHPQEFTSFRSHYLADIFGKYVNFCEYDSSVSYNRNGTLFVKNLFGDKTWSDRLSQDGYKVAVDNLWEMKQESEHYIIANDNWFWYNESLWYTALGYDNYVPKKTYRKLALMPMNLTKKHRDNVLKNIPNLDEFIYSYKDRSLPNDIDKTSLLWQRYFNREWYDDTYFSLVVESNVGEVRFITEKTFKPCAYKHPFMVYGTAGTLSYIKSQGFETYENLFDERYDSMQEHTQRLSCIISNIDNFTRKDYDALTLEKMQHNHNHFFDTKLVTDRLVTEIIEPLINYAET